MNELEQQLRDRLSIDDFSQLWSLLRQFRERGGSADDARRVLETLRAERSLDCPEEEDRILELLDAVVGFCSPHARIWR